MTAAPGPGVSRQSLADLDARDPLADARHQFHLPPGKIYLDGNSLGALPLATAAHLSKVVEQQWGESLIGGWEDHDWVDMPARLGDKIGRLVGAAAGQVLVCDSTSINLFKVLVAAAGLRPDRRRLLIERGAFPTDAYMARAVARWLGADTEVVELEADQLAAAIDSRTAVVSLAHVDYRSGARCDMAEVCAAARRFDAHTVWDLAHSAGVLAVELDRCGADFAVGCGYKFLNGGPGAPAFVYVAERHQRQARQPLEGWFGHASPFAFESTYRPAPGVGQFACGTPPVLAFAALESALDLHSKFDIRQVEAKALRLGDLFLEILADRCGDQLAVACPGDRRRRGAQISLRHPHAGPLVRALRARGVIGDARPPDLLRFGMVPLYLQYVDLWHAAEALGQVLAAQSWRDPAFARAVRVP